MKIASALRVFFRLYTFHRRGGKRAYAALRLAARAFDL